MSLFKSLSLTKTKIKIFMIWLLSTWFTKIVKTTKNFFVMTIKIVASKDFQNRSKSTRIWFIIQNFLFIDASIVNQLKKQRMTTNEWFRTIFDYCKSIEFTSTSKFASMRNSSIICTNIFSRKTISSTFLSTFLFLNDESTCHWRIVATTNLRSMKSKFFTTFVE